MVIIFSIILGIFPSLIWLYFFLKEDTHPEPKKIIALVFFAGVLITAFAIPLEIVSQNFLENFGIDRYYFISFLVLSAIEEIMKFLAAFIILSKWKKRFFDEPVDAMVYLIAASLGFAAIENILVLFRSSTESLNLALQIWTLRSVGATFLHALSGAIIGYFLALSWFYFEHQKKLVAIGIILATLFHFTFNIIVFSFQETREGFVYSLILLLIFAGLIQALFKKIKERSLAARPLK